MLKSSACISAPEVKGYNGPNDLAECRGREPCGLDDLLSLVLQRPWAQRPQRLDFCISRGRELPFSLDDLLLHLQRLWAHRPCNLH